MKIIFIKNDEKKRDYKNIYYLRKFITPQGKIIPRRRLTDLSAKEYRGIRKSMRLRKELKFLKN